MADVTTVVDGLSVPTPIAGDPGLELCNTFAGWGGPPEREYLADAAHLLAFTRVTGLLPGGRVDALASLAAADAALAADAVAHARAARATLYAALSPDREADPEAFDALVAEAAGHAVLRPTSPEPTDRQGPYRWEITPRAGLRAPALAATWAAARLLGSPTAERVRACPGRGCGWLFLDASGRRRWCSMAVCGNRAKARRHAASVRSSRTG